MYGETFWKMRRLNRYCQTFESHTCVTIIICDNYVSDKKLLFKVITFWWSFVEVT